MNNGTPKTMIQAIENGVIDSRERGRPVHLAVKDHVRDFTAQKFGTAYLQLDSWNNGERGPLILTPTQILKQLFESLVSDET